MAKTWRRLPAKTRLRRVDEQAISPKVAFESRVDLKNLWVKTLLHSKF
jgi:hypothetical protein